MYKVFGFYTLCKHFDCNNMPVTLFHGHYGFYHLHLHRDLKGFNNNKDKKNKNKRIVVYS